MKKREKKEAEKAEGKTEEELELEVNYKTGCDPKPLSGGLGMLASCEIRNFMALHFRQSDLPGSVRILQKKYLKILKRGRHT